MAGCKPTDFFTEVLISADADQVDEYSANRTIVNSPDAETQDESLTALDWSEDSLPSENVESLVTWSSEPNSILKARHSIFDLKNRFSSIEASDGVRLVFDAESGFEHSVESGGTTSRNDMTAVSPAINADLSDDGVATESNAGSSAGAISAKGEVTDDSGSAEADQEGSSEGKSGSDASNAGDNQGGNASGSGEGSATSDDPGTEQGDTKNRFAGLGGNLLTFDPTNSSTRIPKVDSIVVIGKEAAVMTEVIGGSGSICAMSNESYNNKSSYAVATFAQVFGSEGNGECGSSVIAWSADSAASIQSIGIENFEAMVNSWPSSVAVIYDQDVAGDPKSLFTSEQLDYLAGHYGDQIAENPYFFLPVDFSSQSGIYNAANLVGQALSESSVLSEGWDSAGMAKKYCSTLQSLVTASESVHGGTFVFNNQERPAFSESDLDYVGRLGTLSGSATLYLTQAIIATDAEVGMSYSGSGVNASKLVLFGGYGMDSYSPLSVWMRAAGVEDENVINDSGIGSKEQDTIFWGTQADLNSQNLSGSGTAYRYWTASGCARNSMWITDQGTTESANGLGSRKTPYLIVCGSSDGSLSSAEVKSLAVESINTQKSGATPTPYTAFSYVGDEGGLRQPETTYTDASGLRLASSIGASNANLSENPLLSGLDANDVVRLNPNGLVSSWIEGNAESVLETLWLTSLYTEGPSGSGYDSSSYSWKNFSITIGDAQISCGSNSDRTQAVRDVITAFYQEFYRYNVDQGSFGYSDIVPDEGL